ncbi:methyl-accepting chemotaxis protein [Maridesulfovibrio hydrothermalis]|uniref:Methyl-accepting chemotaxis sensory transducer n=1 Tax=Maridesulfovibrio hydrothermalis AM13 = DSM 14728 TaxID=1121451 RepID=L0R8A7_9BACT|nr:methyl-accepting chemotaxis protein [Maridesulfovibrio hydrothermalis]CCO22447.1 Methyl-accepting chemotaxis sensory transducer [Maridesulfovibrio hydrothermalis AM13 = DSM 14728]
MTVRLKFLILLVGLVVSMLALAVSFNRLIDAGHNVSEAYENKYFSYLLADELRQSSDDLTRLARTYVVTGNPEYERQYFDILDIRNGKKPRPEEYHRIYWDFVAAGIDKPRPDTQAVALIDLMKKAGFSAAELGKLEEAKKNSDGLVENETIAMNAVKGLFKDNNGQFTVKGKPDLELARKLTHDNMYHKYKANIMKPVDEFFVLLEKRTGDLIAKANKTAQLWENVVIGMIALVIVVISLIAWLFYNVLKQLGEDPGYLYEVSHQIASGDLDLALKKEQNRNSVYGVFVSMVANLKETIAKAENKSQEASLEAERALKSSIEAQEAREKSERARAEGMQHAANQLQEVVEVLSSASNDLEKQIEKSNRGIQLQSNRVSETSTAMEEMNTTVFEVAKNASQAAETVDKAKDKAEQGSNIVGDVVHGIEVVQKNALDLKEDVTELGHKAEGISQVMDVISDIADQTNLLALNAAIEAARAGEAGRGFAVVADEVRKLAEKTMTATSEVGEAIQGIQQGTQKNIENVDVAVKTIADATSLASQSGEALEEIVKLVDLASDQVRLIATSSEEQSASSEEINRTLDDVSNISSQAAEGMESFANSVETMTAQTVALKNLITEMQNRK